MTQPPTLAEFYRQAGVKDIPAFAPFVRLGKEPFKTQVQGVTLCLHDQWYGLLDETGAGKSIPAVAAGLYYIGFGNKVLVVTLASLLYQFAESVVKDFAGVDRYVRIHVLDQGPEKRRKLFAEWDAGGSWPEMVIMSYEMFAICGLYAVMKQAGYDVLITDESQKWKAPGKKFYQRIKEYVGDPFKKETAFFPMTGTPMHTQLTDAYCIVSLLSPGAYTSYDHFLARHCVYKKVRLKEPRKLKNGRKQTHFKLLTGYTRHAELSAALYAHARRVMKRDIPELADLKEPIITEVPVKLSDAHLTLYRRLVNDKFIELDNGNIITALQEQELRQRVLQMVTCPELFLDEGKTIDNQVLATVRDLVESVASESKVILFLHFRETVQRYAAALQEFNPVLIYGGETAAGRERSRQTFLNDPDCRLLIANVKSAGAGFNFQSVSHTTIFGEPMASPGDFKQAMDRVVRPGQLYQCNTYIIKALSTVAPMAIKEMLRREGDITQVTMDAKNLRHFYNFA